MVGDWLGILAPVADEYLRHRVSPVDCYVDIVLR
jgi:hypothetical protein